MRGFSSRLNRSSTASTKCSVSGRGIRTSGETSKSRPKNSCVPVRYCTGSLARRRLSKASKCSASLVESGRSGCVSKAVGSHPSTWARISSPSRRGYCEVEASRERAACRASPAVAGTLSHSGCFSLETLGLVVRDEGIDGRLQPAFHHFRQLVIGQADAMVRETVLGKVVGADFLAAIAAPHLLLTLFGQRFLLLVHFDFIEPGTQHTHRFFPILDLRFLVLATHHRTGRKMGDAHGRVGGIHRLPAGPGGAKCINADVLGLDLHVDLFG